MKLIRRVYEYVYFDHTCNYSIVKNEKNKKYYGHYNVFWKNNLNSKGRLFISYYKCIMFKKAKLNSNYVINKTII